MKSYSTTARGRKRYRFAEIPADLFSWADAQAASGHLPATLAERALMQRLQMPLHMARVIAEIAGIGGRA